MNYFVSILISAVLLACAHRVPMKPSPRSPVTQQRAAVLVEVSCTQANMMEMTKEWQYRDPWNTTITWQPKKYGSGVLVSDDDVITAAHVTTCVTIPTVHVTLSNGIRRRMFLVKEDLDSDVALLRTLANEPFYHGVAPPVSGMYEYLADGAVSCSASAWPRRERKCGEAVTPSRLAFPAPNGNSGSGVYDQGGRLIGIVSRNYLGSRIGHGAIFEVNHTKIRQIPAEWLK